MPNEELLEQAEIRAKKSYKRLIAESPERQATHIGSIFGQNLLIDWMAQELAAFAEEREQQSVSILRDLVESVEGHWQCEPSANCAECGQIQPIIKRAKLLFREIGQAAPATKETTK